MKREEERVYEAIKFGDIEYFELLRLQDELKYLRYDKLGLLNLDRLRHEIDVKVKRIHLQEEQQRKTIST